MEIKVEAGIEAKRGDKKRYGAQEKLLILSEITGDKTIEDVAEHYNMAIGTIKRWISLRDKSRSKEDPLGLGGLSDASSRPKKPGHKIAKATEEEILKYWRERPGFGPSQIQFQLKRDGLKVSKRAIQRVLIENGYEKKHKIGTGELQRFEAERPNKLWQMDILDFWIGKCRVFVMLMLDDHSRFITGFGIFTEATMSHAITVLRRAVNRYGKPEALLTDRGMQFYSWRTMNKFQKLLEVLGVEHLLARPHHPQTCGKIESLNKRLQGELIQKKHFRGLNELEREIRAWVYDYNHNRTHQGIKDPELGSILVPADRYFGRVDEVLAKVRAKLEKKEASPFDYTKEIENLDPFEICKLMEHGGSLEVWFCGRRYKLATTN